MKLSVKLFFVVSIFLVVLGLGIGSMFYSLWTSNMRTTVEAQQIEDARQAIDKIDRLLFERYMDVQEIAGEDQTAQFVLGEGGHNTDAIVQEINDASRTTGPWDKLEYVSSGGTIVGSNRKSDIGTKFTDSFAAPYLAKALAGDNVYSDAVITPQKTVTVVFASPVKDKEKVGAPVVGAVVAHFSWQVVQEIIDNIQYDGVNILNASGQELGSNHENPSHPNYFADYKDSRQFKDTLSHATGSALLPDLENGASALVSYVHESGYLDYHGSGWVIFIQTPMNAIYSMVNASILPAVVLLLAIIIVGAAVLFWVVRSSFIFPLSRLSAAVSKISSGDLSTHIDFQTNDEVGLLGQAFNDMARKLQESRASLESKVEERTAQLTQKARELEKMNTLMVGREIKMVELKKELDALKAKSEEKKTYS